MHSDITTVEIRELLEAVQVIATRPAQTTQKHLMLAPALFQKLMHCRTGGVIEIKILIDGKEINIEVTK